MNILYEKRRALGYVLRGCGGGDPIQQISNAATQVFQPVEKAVNNVVNDVSKTATQVLQPIEKGVNIVVQDVSNAATQVLQPVEKAVNQVVAPIIQATQDGAQAISDEVSHIGHVIATDPVASAAVNLAANYFFPGSGNYITAALAANQIAQGAPPEKVLANAAGNYVIGQAGQYVNVDVKNALIEQGMSPAAATAAASISSGAASGGLRAALTGKDVGQGITAGITSGATNAAAGYTASEVSSLLKESSLPPDVQAAVVSAARGATAAGLSGKDAAVAALTNMGATYAGIRPADATAVINALNAGQRSLKPGNVPLPTAPVKTATAPSKDVTVGGGMGSVFTPTGISTPVKTGSGTPAFSDSSMPPPGATFPATTTATTAPAPSSAAGRLMALGVLQPQKPTEPATQQQVSELKFVDPFGTLDESVRAKTGGSVEDLLRLVRS